MKFLPLLLTAVLAFEGPFQLCIGTSEERLKMESFEVIPPTPMKHKNATMSATGYFSAPVTQGSSIHLQILLGNLPFYTKTADLCEVSSSLNLPCPIEKGRYTISRTEQVPGYVIPGTYGLKMFATTPDGKQISCMEGKIKIAA
jgi:ML domain